jgi:hypothetical protein
VTGTGGAPEMARYELAVLRLTRLRSRHYRHYRIEDPSIFNNTAGICDWCRRRWPCHATTLLGTLVEVLKLTRDGDKDLPPAATVTVGEIREALVRGLLDKENDND